MFLSCDYIFELVVVLLMLSLCQTQMHMNSQLLYFAGMTGHTEVVRVVFHPEKISFASLLKVFWESHDPTQGTTLALKTKTVRC